MKRKSKFFLIGLLTLAMCATMSIAVGCNDKETTVVNPPEEVYEVTAVTISHNGNVVNGMLNADLSLETLQLTTRVDGDEGAEKTVKYTSANDRVAFVDKSGKVILKRAGETMITATAGNVSAKFVLVVSNGNSISYTVTVNGGTADKTTAEEGEYVKLTPNVPLGKKFVEWSFSAGVTWTNGSSFRMPAGKVEIVAIYVDETYTLNVIGATVKRAGTSINPTGAYAGNTKNGNDPAYDIMRYEVANGADVIVEPLTVEGCAFVGFDKDVKNNRVGDIADGEYSFQIEASDATITAIYSKETKDTMKSTGGSTPFNTARLGYKFITAGKPAGESVDPDLNGANGYRFAIPGDTSARTDYPENITIGAAGFDTMSGSRLAFVTFKNHHSSLPVTVEWYLSYQGCGTSTGRVTVEPKTVKKVACVVSIGAMGAPWSGFAVRKAVGGSASDTVLLDMTISTAVQYPDGDKSLGVIGSPDTMSASFAAGENTRRYDNVSNGKIIAYHTTHINDYAFSYTSGLHGEITNLPAFDENNPTVTIYIRAINSSFMTDERTSGFNIAVAKDDEFTQDVQSVKYVMRTAGQIDLIKFEVTRTNKDEKIYITFAPFLTDEEKDVLEWHSATFQFFFNDVIGYEE